MLRSHISRLLRCHNSLKVISLNLSPNKSNLSKRSHYISATRKTRRSRSMIYLNLSPKLALVYLLKHLSQPCGPMFLPSDQPA